MCVPPNDDKTLNAVKFTNLSNHLTAQDRCSLGWEEQSEGWECYLREIFSRAIFSQQSFHEQYFHSRCTLGCHSADWEEGGWCQVGDNYGFPQLTCPIFPQLISYIYFDWLSFLSLFALIGLMLIELFCLQARMTCSAGHWFLILAVELPPPWTQFQWNHHSFFFWK